MQDLETVLRRALESLAFQAPDMGEQVVNDQVLSHLRHHENPLLGWEVYRAAYDAVYDLEKGNCDPYKYCDFPTENYSKETVKDIVINRWKARRELALIELITYEKVA